jgi:RNA polymerase-interacting CarD/CdnL/TRCF family regulator
MKNTNKIDWFHVAELVSQAQDLQSRASKSFAATEKEMLRQAEQELVQEITASLKTG